MKLKILYSIYKDFTEVPKTCFEIDIIPLTDKRLNNTSKIIKYVHIGASMQRFLIFNYICRVKTRI